jgi:ABC-type glycerol-3-phosphate transport system permease component
MMASNLRVRAKANKFFSGMAAYLVLTLAALFSVFPILWALITSLKPESQVMTYPPDFLPKTFTAENYYKVLFQSNYTTYFGNTVLISLISTLIAIMIATHAAYAFSRMRFRHSNKIMFLILMTAMIPAVAQLTPLYVLAVRVGLYNTKMVLVLIYTAWRTPILTWLLKNFFDHSPKEIEEAAIMDGCGRAMIFYRIVLPLARPGIASVALLSAVFVWNDYLVAASFVSRDELRMMSTGIYNYVTAYGTQWGQLMSGVCMAIVPLIILFICLQRQFMEGLSAGAVKG